MVEVEEDHLMILARNQPKLLRSQLGLERFHYTVPNVLNILKRSTGKYYDMDA